MAGFDDPGVFFSDPLFSDNGGSDGQQQQLSRTHSLKRFKEFIKTYMDHMNCFCYRSVSLSVGRHFEIIL